MQRPSAVPLAGQHGHRKCMQQHHCGPSSLLPRAGELRAAAACRVLWGPTSNLSGQVSGGRRQHSFSAAGPPQQRPSPSTRCRVARIVGAGGQEDAEGGQQAQQRLWPLRDAAGLLTLGFLFAAWYGTSIWFNIFAKQLTSVFSYPLTITAFQFAIGSALSLAFWVGGIVPLPSRAALARAPRAVLPLALIHVLGNVLTNVSLGAVAVSFTHTVKAAEPFFSVLFSAALLGTVPPVPVLLTLLPIVGGVVLASFTEATFNWTGLLSALASNITFQSRNVLSKKLMLREESGPAGGLDSINLFQLVTLASFMVLTPLAALTERLPLFRMAELGLAPMVQDQVWQRLTAAALCFHAYQQISYAILSRVQPVTHSIGNCVKRVVVIGASVIAFGNPVSPLNAAGTALALAGVFMYAAAKRKYKDHKLKQ